MRSFSLVFISLKASFQNLLFRSGRTSIMVLFAIVIPATLTQSAKGHVHAAPDGTTISWYPKECCHDGDCRPVASILRAPEGLWMTTVDGITMLVGPSDTRRASRDMRWHICISPDDAETRRIRCVFEPPNS